MADVITYSKFLESQKYFYGVLKKSYLQEVSEAEDKKYASKHFQKILFEENELVPHGTVLFEEFYTSYRHYSRIKSKKGYYQSLSLLKEIRKISQKELQRALAYQKEDKEKGICDWYIERMHTKSLPLEEVIQQELIIQSFTDENLIAALALKLAGNTLLKEFYADTSTTQTTTPHRYSFTQKEQMLAIGYLLESLGVNLLGQSDRTKMAGLFHLLMGVPYHDKKKLKDLSIYKNLSSYPLVVKSDKQLIKYLEKIKPYIQEANFYKAVELINQQITRSKKELD